jgi:hypothetical protein
VPGTFFLNVFLQKQIGKGIAKKEGDVWKIELPGSELQK